MWSITASTIIQCITREVDGMGRMYIDRQAAIDALGERPMVWTSDDDYSLGERNQYDIDRLAIETVQAADIQPVRHGKWNCGDDDEFPYAVCSVCKWDSGEAWEYAKKNFKYCPNCGARQDGEHDVQ